MLIRPTVNYFSVNIHSLTAARNRLWIVAPSMLTGRRQVPMRQQQWVRCRAQIIGYHIFQLNLNRISICFEEDMREKRFLQFRSKWPLHVTFTLQIYHLQGIGQKTGATLSKSEVRDGRTDGLVQRLTRPLGIGPHNNWIMSKILLLRCCNPRDTSTTVFHSRR